MPTLEHNGLVDLFRENPRLAPHLVELLFGITLPSHVSAAVVESTLDQLSPIEFRADLVLELRDATKAVVLAIVLEVQRDQDPRKKYTWPVYTAVTRAERACPAIVLVVTPDASAAAWAAETIDLGLGLGTLRPLVLGPSTVPEVIDPAEAEREAELAILSAVAHGNGPKGLAVVGATLVALGHLDTERAAVYFQIIYDALREPMRRALEALVMERQIEGKAVFPPFAQGIFERGKAEGKLEGKAEGKLEGKAEGKLEGKAEGKLEGKAEGKLDGLREALLRILARAGIPLTAAEAARIQACTDAETLDRWLDNVVGAKVASDVLS